MATAISQNSSLENRYGNGRLMSLDVFRGLAVAGMILVTDPGTYSAVYPPLLHAQWNGSTPTDMIFPAFLFAVGIAIPFSLTSRTERGHSHAKLAAHILLRSILIFILGLLLNGFPDYDLHTLRIPGILQRIALCYLCGSLLYLATGTKSDKAEDVQNKRRIKVIAFTAVTFLAVYWLLLQFVPVPGFGPGRLDSLGNLGAYIDRSLLGTAHMWAYGLTSGYGVTYDPEGLLSTIPSAATLMIGMIAGIWLRRESSPRRKVLAIVGAGIALVFAGWLLHPLLPINKRIWTSTFALFSGGISLLAFSFFYLVLDIKRWRSWTLPLLVFGTNAILAFTLSTIITTLSDRIHIAESGSSLTLHQWGYRYGFATWLQPVHASLAYAILIVLLNLALLYPLYRKRIFLRL